MKEEDKFVKTPCSHSEYISQELFRAKNRNIHPYTLPELQVNFCKNCGEDISSLCLFRKPN